MWDGLAARLEGRLVTLEPLARNHEAGLSTAAQDMDWAWMQHDASRSPAVFRGWLEDALARTDAGLDVAFVTLDPLG